MVYSFSFHVPGKPRGAARPRFTRQGHAYTLREDQIYRALVTAKARKAIRSTRYSGESAQNFRVDIGICQDTSKKLVRSLFIPEEPQQGLCPYASLPQDIFLT